MIEIGVVIRDLIMYSMNAILISLVVLCSFLCQYRVEGGRSLAEEQDLDLERQITNLNKPPIKTVQIKNALYDCIDIYKQPTLDHPSLKNHKVQMKPTSEPKSLIYQKSRMEKDSKFRATLRGINCPQGTVPIRRTRKEDLIRAKNFSQIFHHTTIHPHISHIPGQHVVMLKPSANTTYHGVQARLNVYSLQLKSDQQSTSQIWIENGPPDEYTSLQVGWIVSPHLEGDSDTHLFAYWTKDGFKTGCYNYLCSGFVQVNKRIMLTARVYPLSIYGGQQYDFELTVFQDKTSQHWWLKVDGVSTSIIGYWPNSFFQQFNKGASMVAWGGLAKASPNEDSPPMGNGQFPHGDFRKACYMIKLHTVDTSYNYVLPKENGMVSTVDNPNCYGLKYWGNQKNWGLSFLFGGPGGKCGV